MQSAMATQARPRITFYVGMAVALALTVLIGFGPTFHFKPFMVPPDLLPLTIVHGFAFTSWMAVLLAQTVLAARGRFDLHRRLGIVGACLAALMVMLGVMTAISAAARGVAPGGADPLAFLAIPLADMVVFAVLVGAGIGFRGDGATHKRLMLLSTIAIIAAAVSRLPLPIPNTPLVFFGIVDVFILAGIVHDLRTRGRVHPAYLWGGGLIVALQPLRLVISGTETWLAIARWLTG